MCGEDGDGAQQPPASALWAGDQVVAAADLTSVPRTWREERDVPRGIKEDLRTEGRGAGVRAGPSHQPPARNPSQSRPERSGD